MWSHGMHQRSAKSEARNTKHETNSNDSKLNDQNGRGCWFPAFLSFFHWCLRFVSCFVIRISCLALLARPIAAQTPLDGREGRDLLLENFRPRPMLKVAEHPRAKAKYPVV